MWYLCSIRAWLHFSYTPNQMCPNAAHASFVVHAMTSPMVILLRINSGRPV
jgi:hypothetical protein